MVKNYSQLEPQLLIDQGGKSRNYYVWTPSMICLQRSSILSWWASVGIKQTIQKANADPKINFFFFNNTA